MSGILRAEDGIVHRFVPCNAVTDVICDAVTDVICDAVTDVIFCNRSNSNAYRWMLLTE